MFRESEREEGGGLREGRGVGDRVNSLKIEKSLENTANLKTTIILFRPVTHQQLCDRRHTFKKQKEKNQRKSCRYIKYNPLL